MEILTMEDEKRICPFLDIPCETVCPAWLADLTDCLFHVCLTEVRATFLKAAVYLDKKLALPDGTGNKTLKMLRETISGNATAEDRITVNSVINGLLTSGVLAKIQELSASDLAGIFTGIEKVIRFDLTDLFSGPEEEYSEEEYNEDDN